MRQEENLAVTAEEDAAWDALQTAAAPPHPSIVGLRGLIGKGSWASGMDRKEALDRVDLLEKALSVPAQRRLVSRETIEPAVERLMKLADDARSEYNRELGAGGEPPFPGWTSDIYLLCAVARRFG